MARSDLVQSSLSLEVNFGTSLMMLKSDRRAFVFIEQNLQLDMVSTYASSLRHLEAIRSLFGGRIVGAQGRCFRQSIDALPIRNQAVQTPQH